MIPARYAHILFGFILSGLMSCLVSGIATLRVTGPVASFPMDWMGAWLFSWAVAFPTVLVVAPIARRLVAQLTAPDTN
ncbi:MAG: DUF2798 domain-containing protein [Pseudomonadota bacterium]